MSTWTNRDFRPALHYTPPFGWINDPNGLCYVNGEYHLFAQYYPYDTIWGPMHWIHAVSRDCLSWRQLGVALRPDADRGMAFSGSAVLDRGNTSGLGADRDPLVCMFTRHGDAERQSIAYSTDYVHFTEYADNPVIDNPGCKDFRDPKVLRNPYRDGWTAVIAAGDHVEFFFAKDLIHWQKTGEFGVRENIGGGVFECPDMFALDVPGGGTLWVLTASNIQPAERGGNRAQYFLGEFDGDAFRCTVPFGQTMYLDAGFDNYAPVTFSGAPKPTAIGWAASWVYARELPTSEFCGQMTCARELRLERTSDGLRLAYTPVFPGTRFSVARDGAILPGETFRLQIRSAGPFDAALASDDGDVFRFGLRDDGMFYSDRSNAGYKDFHPTFNTPLFSRTATSRMMSGQVEMDVLFDRCIAELFADGGLYANTTLVFPQSPYTRLRLSRGATASVAKVKSNLLL